ncbi:MAG TPA: hypothetical protein VI669_06325 [Vicinamibacteria bacterium]
MSLILEALRKLERDKDTPERGFVVMTHVPWARGGPARSRLALLALLAVAVAAGALAMALWRGAGKSPSNDPAARATQPPALASPAGASPGSVPPRPAFEARALAIQSLDRAAATRPAPSPPLASKAPLPTPRPEPPSSELRLHAISRQDGTPVAILNDRLVREGDVFDGVRVIRIGETEVEVEVKGQRRVLTF